MDSFEPKKLALLRIWQILKEYSDCDHPLTQDELAKRLERDYGIILERKAIGRNLSLLKEADWDIVSGRGGTYLEKRTFEDSELRLLIDCVLGCKHITAEQSKELIDKICTLSNRYFRSHVKNIFTVKEWGKTENSDLFLNIERIDEAIEKNVQIHYHYNRYGIDKKLHKTSQQYLSPYQLILHNQRYYLMGYSEYWSNIVFHRLDHITDMELTDKRLYPLRSIPGYKSGIDYRKLSTALPYMFTDNPVPIVLLANTQSIDQIIDWFGTDVRLQKWSSDESKVQVFLTASPNAMTYWALQYAEQVEVVSPESLHNKIQEILQSSLARYNQDAQKS